MLKALFPPILILGLLLNLVSVSLGTREGEGINKNNNDNYNNDDDDKDNNTSFYCGNKLFFWRHIEQSFAHALDNIITLENNGEFIPYDGQLQFDHDGPLWMLPLPTQPENFDSRKHNTRYFLVLVLDSSKPKVLGVIHKISPGVYGKCIQSKAAGEITSVTSAAGGLQCQHHVITTPMLIESANRARKLLLTTELGLIGKYPIMYTGDVEFQGCKPFILWRMTRNGKMSINGKYMMALDCNLNVAGALEPGPGSSYLPCKKLEQAKLEPKILFPSIVIGPGEYDVFRCGLRTIKAGKVLQDVKGALDGFKRKTANPLNKYPKLYTEELPTKNSSPLYLWPVRARENRNSRTPFQSRKEPFLAIVDQSLGVHGVVVELSTNKYKTCRRLTVKAGPS